MNSCRAGRVNVERKPENITLPKMRLRQQFTIDQRARLTGGYRDRLEDRDQLVRRQLAHLLQVIARRLRQTAFLEPTSRVCMLIGE